MLFRPVRRRLLVKGRASSIVAVVAFGMRINGLWLRAASRPVPTCLPLPVSRTAHQSWSLGVITLVLSYCWWFPNFHLDTTYSRWLKIKCHPSAEGDATRVPFGQRLLFGSVILRCGSKNYCCFYFFKLSLLRYICVPLLKQGNNILIFPQHGFDVNSFLHAHYYKTLAFSSIFTLLPSTSFKLNKSRTYKNIIVFELLSTIPIPSSPLHSTYVSKGLAGWSLDSIHLFSDIKCLCVSGDYYSRCRHSTTTIVAVCRRVGNVPLIEIYLILSPPLPTSTHTPCQPRVEYALN